MIVLVSLLLKRLLINLFTTVNDERHWCANILCSKRIELTRIQCSPDCAKSVQNRDKVPINDETRFIMNGSFKYSAFDSYFDTHLYVPISPKLRDILMRSFFSPRPSDNERHHRLRHNYLTASNIASVLNMNPYCSVRAILEKYIQPFTEHKDNFIMKRGRDMESTIAKLFINATNIPCIHNQGLTPHSKYKFIAATFDLLTLEGIPVEIKCLVKRKPTRDSIMPTMYWVQCQIQMQVANSDKCFYVEYKERNQIEDEYFNIITVRRDDQWFQNVLPLLKEFWEVVCNYRSFFGGPVDLATCL